MPDVAADAAAIPACQKTLAKTDIVTSRKSGTSDPLDAVS
jgi:hypothetical protein